MTWLDKLPPEKKSAIVPLELLRIEIEETQEISFTKREILNMIHKNVDSILKQQ